MAFDVALSANDSFLSMIEDSEEMYLSDVLDAIVKASPRESRPTSSSTGGVVNVFDFAAIAARRSESVFEGEDSIVEGYRPPYMSRRGC